MGIYFGKETEPVVFSKYNISKKLGSELNGCIWKVCSIPCWNYYIIVINKINKVSEDTEEGKIMLMCFIKYCEMFSKVNSVRKIFLDLNGTIQDTPLFVVTKV